ncbi:polysaccharide biosynthesis/export family protein [Aureimonas leprariae]|uniref:Polysaccharide export protein n=1 Tax=Plantimonas leprariae TaxID=2615207 RepID=A0A7V7PQB3_9HYPH|nr:polysaccharide biosynthesis/export family protein [Aureimonas leprariae]KAB0680232.1 polysaccharide export protein [Aureimonas leprariae]
MSERHRASRNDRRIKRALPLLLLAGTLLSGCGTPGAGPSAGRIERTANSAPQGNFPVVELSDRSLSLAGAGEPLGFASLGGRRFDSNVLRPGDTVDITVFDTGEEGLLSAASSKTLPLGKFRIDPAGYVTLPFVGRIRAAGGSPAALQSKIAASLKGSSVSPQAAVQVTETGGSGFTVNGGVNSAGRYQLTGQGERLLDAIAMAGGPKTAPGETSVTLLRGSSRASLPMDRLIAEPGENVYVQPNDQIFVKAEAPSFISLGAFRSPGEYRFETGELTMAQAVARSGGLADDRANPKKLYLFRYEPAETARRLGALPPNDSRATPVPVAYLVDMTKTQSFFLTQSFLMRKGDTLYAPNAGVINFAKALQVLNPPVPAPTYAAPAPTNSY